MPVEETSALCMEKKTSQTQQACLATAAAAEAAARQSLPRNNGHLQAMDGAGQGWQAPPRFFLVTTSFPETIGIYQQWTVPARVCGLRPDASDSMCVEDASAL